MNEIVSRKFFRWFSWDGESFWRDRRELGSPKILHHEVELPKRKKWYFSLLLLFLWPRKIDLTCGHIYSEAEVVEIESSPTPAQSYYALGRESLKSPEKGEGLQSHPKAQQWGLERAWHLESEHLVRIPTLFHIISGKSLSHWDYNFQWTKPRDG